MAQDQNSTIKINARDNSLWLCLHCSKTFQGGLIGDVSPASQNCPDDGTPLMLLPSLDAPLVGNYLYKGLLGVGGMGVVFKALNPYLDKVVAIKNVKGKRYDEKQLQRFKQEGKLLSKLVHPNLVSVLDFGANESAEPYMVMEFLDGESLASMIQKSGTIALPQALEILIQTCEGLAHAHKFGAVHRDIKPTNIFILDPFGKPTVKLLDFGIAKLCFPEDPVAAADLTRTGEIFGSPLYMSPEQALGKTVDERSDLYSLGCVMYEMLSGRPPVVGKTAMETIFKHVSETPLPLDQVIPHKKYPPAVQALLTCLLAKDPADRIESAEKLAIILASIDSGTASDLRALQEKARQLSLRTSHDQKKDKSSVLAGGADRSLRWKLATILSLIALIGVLAWFLLPKAETTAGSAHNKVKAAAQHEKQVTTEKSIGETIEETLAPEDVQRSFLARELAKRSDTVDLTNVDLSDADFQLLAERGQKLNYLEFSKDSGLTPRRIEMLKNLPLCKLKVDDCDLDDAGLKAITKIKTLRFLTLISCPLLSPGSWASLKQMPELDFLQIEACLVDPFALKAAFPMRNLATLILNGSSKASASHDLRLIKCNEALPAIGHCRALSRLDLTASDVTAKGLQNITDLTRLKEISLASCPKLDDSAVDALIKLPGLESARLSDTSLSPEALEKLLKSSKLYSAVISNRKQRLSPYLENQISTRRLAF